MALGGTSAIVGLALIGVGVWAFLQSYTVLAVALCIVGAITIFSR